MKTFSVVLVLLTFIVATPRAPAMFGRVSQEKERRREAEQRVVQEQRNSSILLRSNQHLHVTISILSVGVVTALVLGAAIGSKTRRDHDAN